MGGFYEPDELIQMEREEEELRLRLAEARESRLRDEGEAPTEDHELVQRLEADWHHALERLNHARQSSER